MGKLVLIFGPNDSGKSRFAEALLSRFPGPRYYVATMIPQTAENRRRIEKHRRQRAGLGFQTLELPGPVGDAPVSGDTAVLLEDVSNLLANAMFARGGTAAEVFSDMQRLRTRCALLAAVTISGLTAEGVDDMGTAAYIAALDRLNAALLDASDAAVLMEDGVPRACKGDWNGIF